MNDTTLHAVLPQRIDPQLDLVLERVVDVPRELVWRAWTVPEHLMKWFTPAPWTTVEAELDLRPGGIFRTVMCSPEGQRFNNVGCYLEVLPNERLIWTNALSPGFRPAGTPTADMPECEHFAFTAVLTLTAAGAGTRYQALVMHSTEASRRQHDEMGFQEGWGKALDQLVAAAKTF
jgi:uncharacterized protein YndB with AHSA1/START domain